MAGGQEPGSIVTASGGASGGGTDDKEQRSSYYTPLPLVSPHHHCLPCGSGGGGGEFKATVQSLDSIQIYNFSIPRIQLLGGHLKLKVVLNFSKYGSLSFCISQAVKYHSGSLCQA